MKKRFLSEHRENQVLRGGEILLHPYKKFLNEKGIEKERLDWLA